MYWHPPQELSRTELLIAKRTRKRRKIFVFLREHRHHIINDELQQKLLEVYNPPAKGSQPVNQLLEELERWKGWMESQKDTFVGSEKLQKALEVIDEIVEQDTEPALQGSFILEPQVPPKNATHLTGTDVQ